MEALNIIGDRNAKRSKPESITGFLGLKGISAQTELAVVGRAVNGWLKDWPIKDLTDVEKKKAICDHIILGSMGPDCPMSWVKKRWGVQEDGSHKKQ